MRSCQIGIALLAFLGNACSNCSIAEADPPTSESISESSADRISSIGKDKERILIRVKCSLEHTDGANPNEVVVDLGEQVCNSEIDVELDIRNSSESMLSLPRCTISCGCISRIPESLLIESNSNVSVPFRIKMPRVAETLNKQVTFWDVLGNPSLQLNVHANVVTPLKLGIDQLKVDSEERHWISLPVQSRSESVDLRKLSIVVFGTEVLASEFKPESGSKGVLRIEVDPSRTKPPSVQSSCMIEVTGEKKSEGTVSIPIVFAHRTVFLPESAIFRRVGSKYQASLRVWSHLLTDEISNHQQIKLDVPKGFQVGENNKFDVTAEPGNGVTTNIVITVQVPSASANEVPSELILRCNKWKRSVPCVWE